MRNFKAFLFSVLALILFATSQLVAQNDTLTRAQVKSVWTGRVMPSSDNLSNTWNSVLFRGDSANYYKTKTNSSDNTPNYLSSKLQAGTGISLNVSGSTNKILTVTAAPPSYTHLVKDTVITIDSVAFKAGNGTTGVIATILKSQGGSNAIVITAVSYSFTYTAPAYNGTSNIGIYPANLTPNAAGSSYQVTTPILAAAASRLNMGAVGNTLSTISNMAYGQDMKVCFTTPGSKPTIGGGTLTIWVSYYYVTAS